MLARPCPCANPEYLREPGCPAIEEWSGQHEEPDPLGPGSSEITLAQES